MLLTTRRSMRVPVLLLSGTHPLESLLDACWAAAPLATAYRFGAPSWHPCYQASSLPAVYRHEAPKHLTNYASSVVRQVVVILIRDLLHRIARSAPHPKWLT